MTCVLLPSVLHSALATKQRLLATVFASIVGVVWFACAVVSIRGTLPLWADELALWQWVLKQHPDSITAKDHLLSTYMGRNDHVHAREFADQIVAENARCPVCLLNAAYLAIADNDEARASLALDKLKMSPLVAYNPGILHGYIFASGELLKLQNDLSGAEEAYRDAINLNPYDPIPQMELASLLASEGKPGEARKQADIALALFATDEREQRRASFEATLAASQAKSRR
jgi:predicted Zn-dependent protease